MVRDLEQMKENEEKQIKTTADKTGGHQCKLMCTFLHTFFLNFCILVLK